jgi:hypothetical protein
VRTDLGPLGVSSADTGLGSAPCCRMISARIRSRVLGRFVGLAASLDSTRLCVTTASVRRSTGVASLPDWSCVTPGAGVTCLIETAGAWRRSSGGGPKSLGGMPIVRTDLAALGMGPDEAGCSACCRTVSPGCRSSAVDWSLTLAAWLDWTRLCVTGPGQCCPVIAVGPICCCPTFVVGTLIVFTVFEAAGGSAFGARFCTAASVGTGTVRTGLGWYCGFAIDRSAAASTDLGDVGRSVVGALLAVCGVSDGGGATSFGTGIINR